MSKIFINYRRDDSAGYAGRLYDQLIKHFDRDHIFMDIDHIEPGEDFIEVIQEKLSTVNVAIILIGKQWLDITDSTGQRRLDDPDDFVRLEIAAILERKIRAIPVLVGGAVLPKSTQLPELLTSLVRRNAFEISDKRFHYDAEKLINALEKVLVNLEFREIPFDTDTISELTQAAEQGNVAAQCKLGWIYSNGKGVLKDNSKAVEWYRKAAEQGNASAQFNLGLISSSGTGIDIIKNKTKAVELYQKAVKLWNKTYW